MTPKVTHYTFHYGRYDPRRRRAWTLASLWLRGYRRIWRGDVTLRDGSIGPWTSELLVGLKSQNIHVMQDERRRGNDRTGEVFIQTGVHWSAYAIAAVVVIVTKVWT